MQVHVTRVAPQQAVAIRYQATPHDIGRKMGEAFGQIMHYVHHRQLHPAGQPFSTYLGMQPDKNGQWQVISGLPVQETIHGDDDIEPYQLPGGLVAITTHLGPYDQLHNTYRQMQHWIKDHDLKPCDGMWECYFTDPNVEPDPTKWRTDIYMPVKDE